MASGDSVQSGGGATRRATPARQTLGDSPEVAESRGESTAPTDDESKYAPRAPGRPAAEPLKVRIQLVVVDGPAAKELVKRQAIVVREALLRFAGGWTSCRGSR